MKTQKQSKLAKRYATALSKLDGKDTLAQLNSINQILASSPDLKEFLLSKLIKKEDKKDVSKNVFSTDVSQEVLNLLYILIDGDKFDHFGAISCEFEKIINDKNNIANARIISAVDLDDEDKTKIITKLEKKLSKKVQPSYFVDEKIIAGLVIKIGDDLIDNSHRTKLDNLKKYLT